MSRARQKRNKQRAAAAVQLRTATVTTGRVPFLPGVEEPVYGALAAVMTIAPYDPATGEYEPWPGYPGDDPAPAAPLPAWAAGTGQVRRLDTALAEMGEQAHARAVTARALAAARTVAGADQLRAPAFAGWPTGANPLTAAASWRAGRPAAIEGRHAAA